MEEGGEAPAFDAAEQGADYTGVYVRKAKTMKFREFGVGWCRFFEVDTETWSSLEVRTLKRFYEGFKGVFWSIRGVFWATLEHSLEGLEGFGIF